MELISQEIGIKTTELLKNSSSLALIGNSPRLLEHEKGDLINSHDLCLRFNDATVKGLEKHVGSRTEIRYIGLDLDADKSAQICQNYHNEIILSYSKNSTFFKQSNLINIQIIENYSELVIKSFNWISELLGESYCSDNGNPPRSGMVMSSMILYYFPQIKISVFGMERNHRSQGDEHYFKDGKSIESFNKNHQTIHCSLDLEFRMFNALIDGGFLSYE